MTNLFRGTFPTIRMMSPAIRHLARDLLTWRLDPSESLSDWAIKIITKKTSKEKSEKPEEDILYLMPSSDRELANRKYS